MRGWEKYPFRSFLIWPMNLGIGPTKYCCRRQEKGKKSWEEKRGCTQMGLETNSKEEE
jgi:hypothetical protein